jgi:uncharacterized protein YkwD
MHRYLGAWLSIVLIAVASRAALLPPGAAEAEQILLALANQARAEAGLAPLQSDQGLAKAARQHAETMAARQELSHQFPGEPDLMQRLAANSDLRVNQVAENVGQASDAQEVHEGFMGSPPHRANLLNPAYNSVGIGVVHRGSELYVVQDFAHRVTSYSAQQAEELIARSLNRIRDDANLSRLEPNVNASARSEACALARSDSLRASAPAQLGQARAILRYTSSQPENLPGAAAKALQDRSLHAFAAGVCFSRSPSYPSGTYWVVLQLK